MITLFFLCLPRRYFNCLFLVCWVKKFLILSFWKLSTRRKTLESSDSQFWFLLVQVKIRPFNSHGFTMCRTVSLPFSRSHGRFFISYGFTNFEQIFFPNSRFSRKQTQAAYSNANKERISSMTNKNKKSIRSSLSLSWALLFIMLEKNMLMFYFHGKRHQICWK